MKKCLIFFLLLSLVGCVQEEDIKIEKKGNYPNSFPIAEDLIYSGVASYYDYTLKSGWSSVGHRVCASRDFPRGTILEATSVANGATTTCKVTDYGPNKSVHPDRIIDLSSTAFSDIASKKDGIINVTVKRVW